MTDLSDLKTLQKRPQHKSITDLKSRCSSQINNGGDPHATFGSRLPIQKKSLIQLFIGLFHRNIVECGVEHHNPNYNATFSNISVILWWLVLLFEEIRENHVTDKIYDSNSQLGLLGLFQIFSYISLLVEMESPHSNNKVTNLTPPPPKAVVRLS